MIKEAVLSSEQALDDYFTALLGDELLLDDSEELPVADEKPATEEALPPAEVKEYQLEPQLQLQSESTSSYTDIGYNEFEAPDLEDVQRLLSQLESGSLADDPEIDQLFEQNNDQIAAVAEAEPEVVAETAVEEEIQEWPEEAFAEPIIDEPVIEEPAIETIAEVDVEETQALETEVELETQTGGDIVKEWQTVARNDAFQVLYFEVNSVVFAVPLDELGGIHRKVEELNHLIGRPDWYLGLQTNKTDQLDVVDTARWAMSEKLSDNSHRENYQYIVMLGESHWGLASNQLMGTEWLSPEKIRWRESAGKRPWLAGMVKEKMCALIHVDAMITMLDAGLDVKALDS